MGEGVGPLGGELKLRRLERRRRKRRKRKGRDQGTTRETAGEKLESLFSVLCLHRTRIPNPTGFFPSSKKAGPHFIGFEAHGGAPAAAWRIGGGKRRRQPHAAEFSEKGLVVDIVTGLIAAGVCAAIDAQCWRLLLCRVLSMNRCAAAASTTALLLRIEDSFFGSSAFAAALWIDTATVLVDKGLIMIIMMMASNKGGILKAPRKASVYSTLSTTLDTIVVTISCTAKSLFPFFVIYLLRNLKKMFHTPRKINRNMISFLLWLVKTLLKLQLTSTKST